MYKLSDYNYNLSKKHIAQYPTIPAHNSKLLIYDGKTIKDDIFYNIDKYLVNKEITLFFNNSKTIKARIPLSNIKIINKTGKKNILKTGEIFVYEIINKNIFECIVSNGKSFRPGNKIIYNESIYFKSIKQMKDGILMEINGINIYDFLEEKGLMPLPPYIKYDKTKSSLYQTEFSNDKHKGSVASPTAGLHFTKQLINKLNTYKNIEIEYITLHIGLGTFRPIYDEDITKYKIHKEKIIINKYIFNKIYEKKYLLKNKEKHGKILAVGTTSCRILESLPYLRSLIDNKFKKTFLSQNVINYWDEINKNIKKDFEKQKKTLKKDFFEFNAKEIILNIEIKKEQIYFDTKIYIYPGYKRKIVDILCTNFHLPKTSLLLLVSSFIGGKKRKELYNYAQKNEYKFYSFGDGMLLFR